MQEPAPIGIIRTSEHDTKLEQGVGAQLKKIGHHVDVIPVSAKPPQSLIDTLREVGGEVAHSTVEEIDARLKGEESATHDRTADSKLSAKEVMGRVSQRAA